MVEGGDLRSPPTHGEKGGCSGKHKGSGSHDGGGAARDGGGLDIGGKVFLGSTEGGISASGIPDGAGGLLPGRVSKVDGGAPEDVRQYSGGDGSLQVYVKSPAKHGSSIGRGGSGAAQGKSIFGGYADGGEAEAPGNVRSLLARFGSQRSAGGTRSKAGTGDKAAATRAGSSTVAQESQSGATAMEVISIPASLGTAIELCDRGKQVANADGDHVSSYRKSGLQQSSNITDTNMLDSNNSGLRTQGVCEFSPNCN